jgi:hypothetical protein
VDVRVETVQIAETRLKPVGLPLQDEELMSSVPGKGESHAQLEGHVEPRQPELARQADPAQIVDRALATRKEPIDSVQSGHTRTWDFQHTVRFPPEGSQSSNEGDKKPLIPAIERNVEEDVFPRYSGGRGSHGTGKVGQRVRGLAEFSGVTFDRTDFCFPT